jgi:putative acetyltransferase
VTATIRPATPNDEAAIRAVHEAAFPTPLEAGLVEALTTDGDAVISLIAAAGDAVLGHVLLSRMRVVGDGRNYRALGLGPVGVTPAEQKRGIGAALIEAGLEAARARNEELVFVLGEPAYYRRFGFAARTAAPFSSPYAGPYFMALATGSGIPLPAQGRAAYAPAFSRLGEAE